MTRTSLAAVLLLSATPALAELTAEEVLAGQLNFLSGYGLLEIRANGEARTASGLTVDSFTGTFRDENGTATLTLGGVELIEQSDGSVRVVWPETLPLTVEAAPRADTPLRLTTSLHLTQPSHVISGSALAQTHVFGLESLAINDLIVESPEPVGGLDLSFAVALAGLAGTAAFDDTAAPVRSADVAFDQLKTVFHLRVPETTVNGTPTDSPGEVDTDLTISGLSVKAGYEGNAVPRHTLDLSLGGIDWTQAFDVPDEDLDMDLKVTARDLALDWDVAFTLAALETSLSTALAAGQRGNARFSAGPVAYDIDAETPDGPVKVTAASGATDARLWLDRSGLRYSGGGSDISVQFTGTLPDMPLPSLGYTLAEASFEIGGPLLPSEDPQPFVLNYRLRDLAVSENLWSLFDPAAQIPRDPLTLDLDLEGTTTITDDLFAAPGDKPFTGTQARLNRLNLSAAGVGLQATGEARETGTPDAPSGAGTLDFTLTGANRLIDTLVEMGLLPDEQAMGARMGLALVARPAGDDILESRIELREDGSVHANGQRIK